MTTEMFSSTKKTNLSGCESDERATCVITFFICRFSLSRPRPVFGESKLVFLPATISTLTQSGLVIFVIWFEWLFTTWLAAWFSTMFGSYGIWTEIDIPMTNLVETNSGWDW